MKVSSPTAVTAVFGAASKAATKPGSPTSAEPGYYSDGYVRFFVSPTGKTVQNFTSYVVNISCTSPVTGAPGQVQGFAIPVAAIKPDGSVGGSITQSGAFAGLPATITYSVSGHMAKATATAAASGSGTYREDIVLKDSSNRTCTSNNQPWTVPKAGPIPQATSMLAAGKYSDGYFTFSVSGSKVLDVTNYVVNITCLPAVTGAPGQVQGFAIPEATINPDGSFTGKATQSGVFAGSPATITYSAAGNFQGLSSNGPLTAAGTYREDIVVTDSAGTHACTSNTLPWFIAHK